MSQTIKLKRSGTANKKPTVSDLALGELAVNTYDGKLYIKQQQGSVETILDILAGGDDGTGRPAGALYTVQINGGEGKFDAIPIGEAGRVLTANGNATPTWEPVPVSGGTVRSIDVSGGATGLSFAGGPITTIGTITMSGTLGIGNGGTGATTVAGAQTNLLPSQTGFPNMMLTTDGNGNLSWTLPPGVSYTTGEGLAIRNDTEIYSTVADNTGTANRLTLTNGDGTLSNLGAGTPGYVLTSTGSGTAPSWTEPLGTVSDIRIVSVPTMGLRITGGVPLDPPVANTTHITTTGTLSLGGILTIDNGGTGANTVESARVNLLPSYSGNNNKVLLTNGTDILWGEGLPPQAGHADNMLVTNGTTASWVPVDAGGTVTSVNVSGGTTGITFSGGPVTNAGTLTMGGVLGVNNGGTGGTLPVDHGGTGATTADAALTNLLPSQAGNAGLILTTNGTSASWTSTAAGSVTSVAINPSTTGLTFSGGPITSAGTFTVGGVLSTANGGTGGLLPIARGGTGQTTADGAFDALAPTTANGDLIYRLSTTNARLPIGTEGQVLTVDATGVPSWKGGTGIVSSVNASGGTTGMTFTGGPITSSGTLTLAGTLGIANGGTGATNATAAFTALAPSIVGNAGKVLSVVGSAIAWQELAAAGALTSVNGGSTGLSFSTASQPAGSMGMSGTLIVANGGTGATTAVGARTNILPSQAGQADKVLLSNGTDVFWGVTPGSGTVTSVDIDPATTGLTFSGGPVTSNGTFLVGGTLNIANGGTGGTSAQQARNNILPPQATHAGQVLVTDGTNASWSSAAGSGTVTSVDASGGSTGMTFSGGPVTTTGSLVLGGTLAIANGGTGQTTATGAINALLPSQTSQAGRVLTTNGTAAQWQLASTLDVAAGSAGQLQFKSTGSGLAASANLTYNTTTDTLTAPKVVAGTNLNVTGTTSLTGAIVANTTTISVAGTPNINPALGNYFIYTATALTTWTMSAIPSNTAYSLTLKLINGGGFAQTWPTNVYWAGGLAPTLTTGTSKFDLIFLTTMDGGTTYQGASLTNFDLA